MIESPRHCGRPRTSRVRCHESITERRRPPSSQCEPTPSLSGQALSPAAPGPVATRNRHCGRSAPARPGAAPSRAEALAVAFHQQGTRVGGSVVDGDRGHTKIAERDGLVARHAARDESVAWRRGRRRAPLQERRSARTSSVREPESQTVTAERAALLPLLPRSQFCCRGRRDGR